MAKPDICVIDSPTHGFIYFTVTKKYTITRSASVTDFNIESGEKIVDHHTSDNRRYAFAGIVTVAEVLGGGYDEIVDPSTIFIKLDDLIETGELCKFTSDDELGFAETDNCVLVNYTISRNESMGDGVEVDVELRRVQFIKSVERTSATQPTQDKVDMASSQDSLGQQDAKDLKLEPRLEISIKEQAGLGG